MLIVFFILQNYHLAGKNLMIKFLEVTLLITIQVRVSLTYSIFLLIMMPNRVFNDHIMSGYTQVIQELINSMGTLYFGKGKGFGIILKTERDIHWKLKFSLLRFQFRCRLSFFQSPLHLQPQRKLTPRSLGIFAGTPYARLKSLINMVLKRGVSFLCVFS